jgi:WD40 repeat protein/class 3 adenylate cyclase
MTDSQAPEVEAASTMAERGASEIKVFLIADVRGYTHFTQAHGDEAAARLASKFASVTRTRVEAAGGSVIELRGDEALAVFGSPREALRAAIDLQARFIDESARDPALPLTVGIGLDAGEAVRVENGYRGAPLNVAARLCSLAATGEVLASQEVVHLARRVEGARFLDHGPTTLKGIAHPVHVVKIVAESTNPYKGLRPFDESDSSDFFGREALIETILARLNESGPRSRFLAIVGPSGSGKSSVVKAGVIPAVRNGAVGGAARPLVALTVPGQDPIKDAAVAVESVTASDVGRWENASGMTKAIQRALPAGSELFLVIDQFEELFTLVEDEGMRQLFLDGLCASVLDETSRLRVIVTLRADFYDRPLLYKEFGDLVGARTQAVTALSPREMERAISGPAERAGVALEKGLVAQILADVSDQPGALPLLQYALTELFDHRRGTTMTLDAYEQIGGVSGALVRRAESLYEGLEAESQDAVRQLFLRLAASEEDIGTTRRRVAQSEILSIGDPAVMESVFDIFGSARLLSFDRDPSSGSSTVEVAHEALLVHWPRLRGWLEAAAEDLRAQRRLASAATEWVAENKDPSFLLSGSRLLQLRAWRESSDVAITQAERDFLDASIQEHARREAEEHARELRERDLERRSVRRLRALVAVMAVAAVIAGAITIFAFGQQRRAENEARNARARELSAAALANLDADPELSILLAEEAIEQTRSADGSVLREAEEALHRAVGASRIVLSVPRLGGAVDWGRSGVFVTEGPENTGIIDIRDATTGKRTTSFKGHDVDVNSVAFSHDGSMLATTGDDGALKVWGPDDGKLQSSFAGEGEVWGPSFSPDGSLVSASWPDEGSVRVMRSTSGRVVNAIRVEGLPFDTDLSPDGRRVAVTQSFDRFILVFDVRTGERLFTLRGLPYGASTVAWNADGRLLATASNDGSVYIWDGRTGRQLSELIGHTGVAITVDWSPDSKRLLSGGSDGTARVWQLREHGAREIMSLSAADTRTGALAAFSPDASHVVTGDFGIEAAKVWDVGVAGDAEWASFPTDELAPVAVSLLPNGDVVAPIKRGSAAIWDVESGRRVTTLGPARDIVAGRPITTGSALVAIAVSPDGTRVAAIPNFSRVVTVWDPSTGDEAFHVEVGTESYSTTWSPNSQVLAIAAGDSLSLHDRAGNEIQRVAAAQQYLESMRFAPEGDVLVTGAADEQRDGGGKLTWWTLAEDRHLRKEREMEVPSVAVAIAFDPAGTRVAAAQQDGSVQVFDAENGRSLVRFSANSGPLSDVEFSNDGNTIATAGEDGTVRLFSSETGTEELVLRGHRYLVTGVEFSEDGRKLVSASADGVVRVWALDLDDLIRIANDNVTRDLTDAECRQYLHQDRCGAT